MGVYTSLARPLLFTLAPETAQKLAEAVLAIKPLWKATRPFLELKDGRLHCAMGGIALPNPVGLAAGYDKDGRLVDRLANLGLRIHRRRDGGRRAQGREPPTQTGP